VGLTEDIENVGQTTTFGPETEKAIVSLVFEQPEFFTSVCRNLSPEFFKTAEAKWVMGVVTDLYEEIGEIPPRKIVKDRALHKLTVEDDYEPIIELIDRPSDRREIPFIKNALLKWARDRAFGLLYDDEGLLAYEAGDYERLEEIFEQAKRITDVSDNGLWFFENPEILFDINLEKHYTCGFSKLDIILNDGGPTKKEVVCWMAATGGGKSILLCHSGIANLKRGCKVLHVTLELSKVKTALRYAGAISGYEVHKRWDNKKEIISALNKLHKSYGGDLAIYEYSPNEISINHISQLLDQLRRKRKWVPDILVIDYLECMIASRNVDNKDEYHKQKTVSTEIRQLARNEDLLIFTATQTNRETPNSRNVLGSNVSGMSRVAESYGKLMPMDYVVSANQQEEEYNPDGQSQIRLFVAKNRNGEKNKTVHIKIDYKTFKMEEKNISNLIRK